MKLTQITMTLVLAASAALANEHVIRIRDQAVQLEKDYRSIGEVVKGKAFDASLVQARFQSAGAGIEKLKQSVTDAEVSGAFPALDADWVQTKTLIALISVFHDEKGAVLAGEPQKNRGLLKAHSKGLVQRAAMLQKSSGKLLASIPSAQ